MQALQEAHGAAESSGTTAGYWKNSEAMQRRGGCILGVCQPSMIKGYMTNFRLADVLGVDQDTGERCCHGRIFYKKAEKFFGDDSVFSKKRA